MKDLVTFLSNTDNEMWAHARAHAHTLNESSDLQPGCHGELSNLASIVWISQLQIYHFQQHTTAGKTIQ